MENLVQIFATLGFVALAIAALLGIFAHHKYAVIWITWFGVCAGLASLGAWFHDKESKRENASILDEKKPDIQFYDLAFHFPDDASLLPKLTYKVVNIGNASGTLVIKDITSAYTRDENQRVFKYESSPVDEVELNPIPGAFYPGTMKFNQPLAPSYVDDIKKGLLKMFIFARCEYRDQKGKIYPMRFAVMYDHEAVNKLVAAPADVRVE